MLTYRNISIGKQSAIVGLAALVGVIGLLWLSSLRSPPIASAGATGSLLECPQTQLEECDEEALGSGCFGLPALPNADIANGEYQAARPIFLGIPTFANADIANGEHQAARPIFLGIPTFANADIANGEHQAARPGIFDLHLTTY